MPVVFEDSTFLLTWNHSHADEIDRMWGVFTKCKDNLQDGRRLENMSWRLWYQQQHKKAKPTVAPLLSVCTSYGSPPPLLSPKEPTSVAPTMSLDTPPQDTMALSTPPPLVTQVVVPTQPTPFRLQSSHLTPQTATATAHAIFQSVHKQLSALPEASTAVSQLPVTMKSLVTQHACVAPSEASYDDGSDTDFTDDESEVMDDELLEHPDSPCSQTRSHPLSESDSSQKWTNPLFQKIPPSQPRSFHIPKQSSALSNALKQQSHPSPPLIRPIPVFASHRSTGFPVACMQQECPELSESLKRNLMMERRQMPFGMKLKKSPVVGVTEASHDMLLPQQSILLRHRQAAF